MKLALVRYLLKRQVEIVMLNRVPIDAYNTNRMINGLPEYLVGPPDQIKEFLNNTAHTYDK